MEKTNRKRTSDIVGEFEQDYQEALVATVAAAETTATPSWQALYTGFRETNQKRRREAAEVLHEIARELCGDVVPPEDRRKALGDARKDAMELCEADDAFNAYTVEPLRYTVTRLGEIIAEYQAKADSEPELYAAGVAERLADAVAAQPKATWNPRIGAVIVNEVK